MFGTLKMRFQPWFKAILYWIQLGGQNRFAIRCLWWGLGIAIAVKWWLVSGQAMSVFANAVHDHRLYMDMANQIIQGNWLGPFHLLTMVRGVFFPLWIAAMYYLHIPLFYSYHLIYISGLLIMVYLLKAAIPNAYLRLAAGCFLLFNPMTFSAHTLVILRTSVYTGLVLLIVSLAMMVLWKLKASKSIPWFTASWLGICLTAFWLTRDEGIWVLPALLIIQSGWFIQGVLIQRLSRLRILILILLPFVVLAIGNSVVAGINYHHYGVFYTSELKSQSLQQAVKAMTFKGGDRTSFDIPVSTMSRQRMYAISPALKKLEPFLEGQLGASWAKISSTSWQKPDNGEIYGNWFVWALREAVAKAGYYQSAPDAEKFYQQVTKDIQSANREKKLLSQGTRFQWSLVVKVVGVFFRELYPFIALEEFIPYCNKSVGDVTDLLYAHLLTQSELAELESQSLVRYTGWAFHSDQPLEIDVVNGDNIALGAVTYEPSRDVYQHFKSQGKEFPMARLARFKAYLPDYQAAELRFLVAGKEIHRVVLDGQTQTVDGPTMYFYLESKQPIKYSLNRQTIKINDFKVRQLQMIGAVYKRVIPWFMIVALVVFCSRCAMRIRKRHYSNWGLFALALLTGVMTRLVGLAFYQVVLGNGFQVRLTAPVYPLVLLFIVVVMMPWEISPGKKHVQKNVSFNK